MKINAVTFDAAGTLIHLTDSVGTTYSQVAAQFGTQIAPPLLESAFRTVWKRTPAPFTKTPAITSGLIDSPLLYDQSINPEKNWWSAFVRAVFEEAGAKEMSHFEEFFKTLYQHFETPGCWELDESAHTVLDHASNKGLKIGLLSNFDSRLRKILANLEILDRFHSVVLSGEVKASKPDHRMFHTIATELGCDDPGTILHVGDDPECDVAGATEAGFQVFHVKRPHSPLRELLKKI